MLTEKFNNLYDFFNYIEFCPLCNSRMFATAMIKFSNSFISMNCDLTNNDMILSYDDLNISVNLKSNKLSSNSKLDNNKFIIGKQCNKYHFFYNGVFVEKNSSFDTISLDKYHFIKIKKSLHFTINGSLYTNSTSIRITDNYQTREVIVDLIHFDFSSPKSIDKKLKTIHLLG